MNKNILLCGVGGQGTVLASKLIAAAAMLEDKHVLSAETIGMAQKGGSVFSHVRIGDEVNSPMIAKGEADVIIGFEPAEAVRMLPYLKEGGMVVVNSRPIMPVTSVLGGSSYNGREMIEFLEKNVKNLIVVDCEEACKRLKSPRVLNMVLLGAAASDNKLGVLIDSVKEAMKRKVKPQFHELNLKALDYAKQELKI